MEPIPGYSYIIRDEFFDLFGPAAVSKICCNKGAGHGRPYYCCKQDANPDLFWMIPLTTKYQKYSAQYETQMQRYGECITITLAKYAGRRAAVLIQNAVPVHKDFVSDFYRQNGNPIPLHTTVQRIVYQNLQRALAIDRRGGKIFFPDVGFIKELQETLLERGYKPKLRLEDQISIATKRAAAANCGPQGEQTKGIQKQALELSK